MTPTRAGYQRMGVVLAVGMVVAMLVGVAGIARLRGSAATGTSSGHSGWRALRTALRDRQFRWLVAAYLAMSTTTHLVLAGVPYYAEYELRAPDLTTVLVAAFVAPALLVTPAWLVVARRVGKQRRCSARRARSPSARWCWQSVAPPACRCWSPPWRCSAWRSPACSCCRSRCCPT
ncbi:MFS transporter [Micromonospora sp. M12]